MGYWDYDEPYWEPSEADILFDEIKDKLIDAAKDSLKSDMESLKLRNEYLEKRNRELEKKISQVEQKERDLNYKAENLKREVEKEFYAKNVQDIFEEWLNHAEVWYAEAIPYDRPKCNLCNEERKWVVEFPDGSTTYKDCTCNKKDYVYEPRISQSTWSKFHKTKIAESIWGDKCRVYLSSSYQPNKEYAASYDCYSEFHIERVFERFNDETIEYHKNKRYGERLAFESKEECQKYCNWLNEERKKQND